MVMCQLCQTHWGKSCNFVKKFRFWWKVAKVLIWIFAPKVRWHFSVWILWKKIIFCLSVWKCWTTWQKACCVTKTFGQIKGGWINISQFFWGFVLCPKKCPSNRKLEKNHTYFFFRPQAETIFLAMLMLLNDSFLAIGAKIQTCIDNCIHFQANLTLKIDNQVFRAFKCVLVISDNYPLVSIIG
mgnify:CR=1 FL=1